jgi:hypothetical protein
MELRERPASHDREGRDFYDTAMSCDEKQPPDAMVMSDVELPRAEPQIIRVPPPEGWAHPVILVVLWIVFGLLGGVVLVVAPYPANCLIAAIFLVLAVLGVVFTRGQAAGFRRERAAMLAKYPDIAMDPLVRAVGAHWRRAESFPPAEKIVAAFLDDWPGTRARIVCLGPVDVPTIGEMRFEPYIITATELLWRRLMLVPLLLVPLAVWLLKYAHVISWRHVNPGFFGYPLLVAAGAALTWIWRGVIRPTYVRMAPGIVQVLEYRLGRRKPVIRSYPMGAGTLVVIRTRKTPQSVTLLRGGLKDVLPIAQMRHRQEVMEHIWRALLSTAPIPRMSEEELLE